MKAKDRVSKYFIVLGVINQSNSAYDALKFSCEDQLN